LYETHSIECESLDLSTDVLTLQCTMHAHSGGLFWWQLHDITNLEDSSSGVTSKSESYTSINLKRCIDYKELFIIDEEKGTARTLILARRYLNRLYDFKFFFGPK